MRRSKPIGMKRIVLMIHLFIFMPLISFAQEYPHKPINVFSPTEAGNSLDLVPRSLFEETKKFIGQSFIVMNKPGGGGSVSTLALAKAKPDGYTIGVCSPLPLIVTPFIRKMNYSLDDFTPILIFADTVAGLVVRADSPWKTIQDLVRYAKQNPRKIRCAVASGAANFKVIGLRAIAKKEGIDWIYVSYTGGDGPGLTDLLGGHVDLLSAGPTFVPQVTAGKLRLLACYMGKRMRSFPDVPTLEELGYGLALEVPAAIMAPKGVSPSIVKKLDEAFRKGMNEPGFKSTLKRFNYEEAYYNADEATKWFLKNKQLWAKIIKEYEIPTER